MFNKSGKTLTIFIALTFILLVSSTSIGFYLYHQEERAHKSVQGALDAMRASNDKLQAQLKDVQGQLALVMDKNKEADQKINNLLDEQDLNEGLRTALKKENAQLKDQLADTEKSKEKIKADLDDSASKLSQYQQLLTASENKNKELKAHLDGLAETNEKMEGKLKDLNSSSSQALPTQNSANNTVDLGKIVVTPPQGSGHILSVDMDAEFVVFNLGLKQGVKPDALLGVYRGSQYLGDIKATRVEDELSAADIISPLSSKDIDNNDTVVLKS